jgi:putative transposase
VIVEFIDAHRPQRGFDPIYQQLQAAPSTYYAHRSRPALGAVSHRRFDHPR